MATEISNHPTALFEHRVPPLDIILYAIRRVLGPPDAPCVSDIPDLLDFATSIEFYRALTLSKVEEALRLHQYYQTNKRDAALSKAEAVRLREYQMNDISMRKTYIGIILQYCELVGRSTFYTAWFLHVNLQDIYRLWTNDPPRPADLTLRLCEYFPMLNAHYAAAYVSPRLFHYDMSATERELLRLRGLECCTFVYDSCAWAAARSGPGQPLVGILQTPAFTDAFPCKVPQAALRQTMKYYMDTVEGLVSDVQNMFPHDTTDVGHAPQERLF
ncbi:hypothetical protein B0H13DRAFT_2348151 [Mycena leptocephala]|nr:hypothetical protein B0H13DRAFT_2348151 [Mycena leptocephala]